MPSYRTVAPVLIDRLADEVFPDEGSIVTDTIQTPPPPGLMAGAFTALHVKGSIDRSK